MGSPQSSLGKGAEFEPGAPKRITWGTQLATGYDRLKYGLYVAWEKPEILQTFADAKERAKEINEPIAISFSEHGDLVFNVHPTGRKGGYAYHLSRSDVNIFFSIRKDTNTPNIWVDIGSQSCWSPGYHIIIDEVKQLVAFLGGHIIKDVVSEVHLCADFVGLDIEALPIDFVQYWITRANRFHSYRDRSRLTGVSISQTFGELPPGSDDSIVIKETGIEFGKGDIMLRIYDKALELKRNATKASVFAAVWQQETFDEQPVTRIEYQLRRPVLRELRINTLSDLHQGRSGVWRYLTQDWTRFTIEEPDRRNRHQDRAILHPWWKEVQQADFQALLVEVRRVKLEPARNVTTLMSMVLGALMSVQTIRGVTPNVENVIAQSQALISEHFNRINKEKTVSGKCLFDHKMKKRFADIWPMGHHQPTIVELEEGMG